MAKLKSYKLSCVGLDGNGHRARFTFFVYDVMTADAARDDIRSSKYHRKILRQQNVNWKTVTLRAVRCNQSGGVGNTDRLIEEHIERQERQEQDLLFEQWRIKSHWSNVEKLI